MSERVQDLVGVNRFHIYRFMNPRSYPAARCSGSPSHAYENALAMDPDIILADEPTGNLDTSSGGDIMNLFQDLWEQGRTILVITHDPALAKRAPRQVEIR